MCQKAEDMLSYRCHRIVYVSSLWLCLAVSGLIGIVELHAMECDDIENDGNPCFEPIGGTCQDLECQCPTTSPYVFDGACVMCRDTDNDCVPHRRCENFECVARDCDNASDCRIENADCTSGQGGPDQCGGCVASRCRADCFDGNHCNDDNPCTLDACSFELCTHSFSTIHTQVSVDGEIRYCDGQGNAVGCTHASQCDDGDPCTENVCRLGVCDNDPVFCPEGEVCVEGDCHECVLDSECHDDKSCTTNRCEGGTCVFADVTNGTLCTDGPQSGQNNDACFNGECVDCVDSGGCAANQVCQQNSCVGCVFDSDCGGTNLCQPLSCEDGVCTVEPVECEDEEVCVDGNCIACLDDADCADDDLCTLNECVDGQCQDSELTCPESLQCVRGDCVACREDNDCDDRVGCTDDICASGQCQHTPKTCSAGRFCDEFYARCVGCTANSNCAQGERCDEGECVSVPCQPGCFDNEKCINGACYCETGYTGCDGRCVDLSADTANCGDCNFVCFEGLSCVVGNCVERSDGILTPTPKNPVTTEPTTGCVGCSSTTAIFDLSLWMCGIAGLRRKRVS